MKMKKTVCALAAAIMAFGSMGLTAFAASDEGDAAAKKDSAEITITISNAGELEVTRESLTVTDANEDGALTIYDAFYLAHEEFYEGGAEAGFATVLTQYGLSLTKVWGVENGGSYGYYLNDGMAFGLDDAVTDEDDLYLFVYEDAPNYSDKYSFFDVKSKDLDLDKEDADGKVELTLSYIYFDANYQAVAAPYKNAAVYVNGEKTDLVTDEDGKVTVTFDKKGEFVVTAKGAGDDILVPPVCVVNVVKTEVDDTNDNDNDKDKDKPTETDVTPEKDKEKDTKPANDSKNDKDKAPDAKAEPTKGGNPKTSDACTGLVFGAIALAGAGVIAAKKHEDQ